jgi:hypothetical protein
LCRAKSPHSIKTNVQITKVVWTASPSNLTMTNTNTLPLVVGAIPSPGSSGTLDLSATLPAGVTGYNLCVSGTATYTQTGFTIPWKDILNCH